ncbi:hypothetical protein ABLE68_11240 [Nocardioides sp. CN2-186]|uniref:hypothetical protein n=1 Tax=Nocardioides tweenelious TaxID=3156607 RepID=UPI0032B358E7
MHLRQSVRLLAAAGALVLATPVLASCGFNYATDRVYTPGSGVNDRDASVDVLSAVVVSAQSGSGTFIASFANNNADESATVTSIVGSGDDADLKVTMSGPIEIAPQGLVNLATDGGVPITGDLEAGQTVSLTITFGDGSSVDMTPPVVADCGDYSGLDTSATDTPASDTPCEVESPDATEE